MKARRSHAAVVLALSVSLLFAACESAPSTITASQATTTAPASPVTAPAPTATTVADFPVVAYQGDQAFGGHVGHFSAVFAAGRPVVLLYFAGL